MTFSVEEVRKEIQGFAGYCYSHHGVGSEMIDIATEYAAMLEQRESVTYEDIDAAGRAAYWQWETLVAADPDCFERRILKIALESYASRQRHRDEQEKQA